MRRLILTFVLIVSAVLSMNAQNGEMYYKAGHLYMDGQVIEPAQLRAMVGPDIYSETCSGALRQCRVAKTLSVVGASAVGAGFVTVIGGAALAVANDRKSRYSSSYSSDLPVGPFFMMEAGALAMVVGGVCLDVALPFGLIGLNRLKWVAEDYNQKGGHATEINLGLQKNGFGIAMNF